MYEQLQIEQALPLLRQLLSPEWPFEVTPAQRVNAYKYLGASLVLVGKSDSGVVFFRAALERDPFADLDPSRFTPAQLAAFAAARRLTFALGVRPVADARVDPRTERVSFTLATTHAATVEAALRRTDAAEGFPIFSGSADGLTVIGWDGLGPDRTLARPGRYHLAVVVRSRLATAVDSASIFFDLDHDVAPLEDTLADLPPGALLPERAPAAAATGELVKGVAIAGVVLTISTQLASARLGEADQTRPAVVAGAALVTGAVAFLARRRHRDLPANTLANQRRREERRLANAAIHARNAEKIARTVLVVRPAAGVGP